MSAGRRLDHASLMGRVLLVATIMTFASPSSAQLKVIISGGFSPAYQEVLPEFERTTGIAVTTGSGASQGGGPQTIAAQLRRGVPADVVILSREGLTELISAGRIVAFSDVDLASVPIGAAVRAGAPKPDIGTVDAFKQALLTAKTVVVPGSTSGIYLKDKVFPQLGIADKINLKVTERGSQATAMLAAGDADIAVQPVSELATVPGIDVIGRIPSELQLIQVFAAAIVTGTNQPDAARNLIDFLASEHAAAAMVKSGMEPVKRGAH